MTGISLLLLCFLRGWQDSHMTPPPVNRREPSWAARSDMAKPLITTKPVSPITANSAPLSINSGRVGVFALSTLIAMSAMVFAQSSLSQQPKGITVEGRVRDTAGEPVALVSVRLQVAGSSKFTEA